MAHGKEATRRVRMVTVPLVPHFCKNQQTLDVQMDAGVVRVRRCRSPAGGEEI